MLNSSLSIKFLAVLWLVAVSANATPEPAPEEYSYEEVLQVTPTAVGGGLGSVIHLRVALQAYVQFADIQVSAKDCTTDAYDCFESCTFSFAVPTLLITPNVNWTAGNRHYRVLRH